MYHWDNGRKNVPFSPHPKIINITGHTHTYKRHTVGSVYQLSFLFQTGLVAQLPVVRQPCYLAVKVRWRRDLSTAHLIRTDSVFTLKVCCMLPSFGYSLSESPGPSLHQRRDRSDRCKFSRANTSSTEQRDYSLSY